MKVVHVITDLDDGGAEGVLARLCLHSPEIEHVVVSLTDSGKYGSVLEAAGVRVCCLNMGRKILGFAKIFQLCRLILREKPDVVQTWMYHADLFGGIAARLVGIKKVFWGIRCSNMEMGRLSASTKTIIRICSYASFWLPKKIICCAHDAKKAHHDVGYDTSRMIVIPNGYDLDYLRPDEKAGKKIRTELGIQPSAFVIGMVARFDPVKDHISLLRAFAKASQQKSDWKCLLVGKGLTNANEELCEVVNELDISDSVMLLGQRNDIPSIMNAMDLHVLSSLSEGFPNVLAEAMSCGVPCVSTDVGDAKKILLDGSDSCPIQDPETLAQLIINMEHEFRNLPEDWQTRKANSTAKIARDYSIEVMVRAYVNCWSD